VRHDERRTEVETVKNQRLGRLRISMVLEGDYENVRRFIYDLEMDPSFVIIDDVTLTQGDPSKPLMLTLELSTYFRTATNGD
jgi:Tfp pilus assembly protein PilO